MVTLSVIASLLVVTLGPALQGRNCELKPDLYQARKHVEERYASEVGNDYVGHRSIADALEHEKQDIDKQYFAYMSAVSQAIKNREGTQACCTPPPQDRIARHMYTLGVYLQDRSKGFVAFVEDVPADKESARALWTLDEIAHSNGNQGNQLALPFGPTGPVNKYLSELFRLVVRGDEKALGKYLGLYAFADGEYAESMQAQFETLLLEHPEVVVANWQVIRRYRGPLSDVREAMSVKKRQEALSRIRQKCALDHRDCAEIFALLK